MFAKQIVQLGQYERRQEQWPFHGGKGGGALAMETLASIDGSQ